MMPMDRPLYLSPSNREASESYYHSSTPSPTSSISISSFQEVRSTDAEPECQSPSTVAGRFGKLQIRGDRLMDAGFVSHDIQSEPVSSPYQSSYLAESYSESGNIHGPWPAVDESYEAQEYLPRKLFQQRHATNELSPSSATSSSDPKSIIQQHSGPSIPTKLYKQRPLSPSAERIPEDSLTWRDHEITGHNPIDPNDDGYGINGVGFKPTAAIAWARAQKRQKQVAEWKTREAREAREKRRERRNDGLERHRIDGINKSSIQKRVKFDF